MAWTTPKTDWETGELVAASDLNAIGENLAALKHPATAVYTTTADLSIPKDGSFSDLGSSFNLALNTTGGDVTIHFHGKVSSGGMRLDVAVDGSRIGDSDDGIWRSHGDDQFVCFSRLVQNLSAGSHVFKLQSQCFYGRTLYAGAQFWVREI